MLKLNQMLASNAPANPDDVRSVKRVLNWLGYYTPPPKLGLNNTPDRELFTAITAFQKDNNLPETGSMKPSDKTSEMLGEKSNKDNIPGFYIWRTAGDNRVRASHAAREDRIFSWDSNDLAPGEAPGCRCTAMETTMPPKCILIWNDFKTQEQTVRELRDEIYSIENEIQQNNEKIKEYQDKIIDSVGIKIPDLITMDLNAFLKLLRKIIGRAEVVIKFAEIMNYFIQMQDMKKQNKELENKREDQQQKLDAAQKLMDQKLEEFATSCPDYFQAM